MVTYKSKSGKKSGVIAYEMGEDYIKVKFENCKTYTYTNNLNSKNVIDYMKSKAIESIGLSTFIAKNKDVLKFR
ncbi:MAG: hypothetical protein ACK4VL_14865 [Chitinophagales bacterium]|jgi:hypothetical protein